MNDEYTPVEEEVREAWAQERQEVDWNGNVVGSHNAACAEFDRFIAKIKADALRDSVEYFEGIVGVGEFREETRRDGRHWVDPDRAWGEQGPFMDWLRNHADRIERGDT